MKLQTKQFVLNCIELLAQSKDNLKEGFRHQPAYGYYNKLQAHAIKELKCLKLIDLWADLLYNGKIM